MKKILMLLFIITLTGCTVNYNLTIDNNYAIENITVDNAQIDSQKIPAYYYDEGVSGSLDENGEAYFPTEDDETPYYNANYQNNSATFRYSFSLNDYINSTASHYCLKSVKLQKTTDDNYLLNTSNDFSCFNYHSDLDEINVNINIDRSIYNVISNNADTINNNTYTWHITRDNYKNKFIQLEYNKKIAINENIDPGNDEDIKDDVQETSPLTYILVISSVVLLLIGIFGLIKYKSVS